MPLERSEKSRVPVVIPVPAVERIHPAAQKMSMEKQNSVLSHLGEINQADSDVERKSHRITPVDYNSYCAVRSFSSRVRFIVMHYTAADFKTSVNLLTRGAASAHYLVPDPSDPSYLETGNKDVKIFNLVDEKDRAWHAGVSSWRGRNNLNDTSIGIEIVNQAKYGGYGKFIFPQFNPQQISAVKELATNIIQRYPDISPVNVVGHSDIAPGRKSDPGAAFPWKQLSEAGIGAWYDESTKAKYMAEFSQRIPAITDIVSKLKAYGYDVAGSEQEGGFKNLVRAFQLHFRPVDYSGEVDVETAAILYALVEKYP